MLLLRRNFLVGMAAAFAAPAIVRAESIMPIPRDPLVRGIWYQSWPWDGERPRTSFFQGVMRGDDMHPLSEFLMDIDRYKPHAPQLSWRIVRDGQPSR